MSVFSWSRLFTDQPAQKIAQRSADPFRARFQSAAYGIQQSDRCISIFAFQHLQRYLFQIA